ncbi:hypothetical protein [Streptomyces sp. NPDC007988]|uniref:hypothetical protein n=1 Tax=Streptomyces sp. NPDC007988 TaxID=3364802 RepID=UPI0036E2D942
MTEATDHINRLTDRAKHAQEQVQSAIAKNREQLSAAVEQAQREAEQQTEQLRRAGACGNGQDSYPGAESGA